MKKLSKNLDEGIETGYYLALSDEVEHINGKYFDSNKVSFTSEKGYSLEKEQMLVDYCEGKIQDYKRKLNDK